MNPARAERGPIRRRRAAAFARFAVPLLLLLGTAGCAREELWARWRAERAFWHAQRELDRIFVQPRVARPSDFARAERSFRRIVEAFPSSRWARTGANAAEREIAEISGRSALALARLDELQSHDEAALAGYERAETEWRVAPAVSLDAAVYRAAILESLDRPAAASRAWEHVARDFPLLDPGTGDPREGVLRAARRLAEEDADGNRATARDSLLGSVEAQLVAALDAAPSAGRRIALADALADFRDLGGDVDGSLEAQRVALQAAGSRPAAERARRIEQLGEHCLAAGRPDSAARYARWGAAAFGGRERFAALELVARAQRAAGFPDSAIETYGNLLNEFPHVQGAAEARYQRAVLLESLGRWVVARSEYSALCAEFPSSPRALEAWERVVRHHRRAGEDEMARIETQHALDALDQLIHMQHDATERARIVEARAAVLLAAGRAAEGIRELQGLWSDVGLSANGARIGMIAADEAEKTLKDRALARRLWQILSRRSPDPRVRRQAAAALESRAS